MFDADFQLFQFQNPREYAAFCSSGISLPFMNEKSSFATVSFWIWKMPKKHLAVKIEKKG